MTREQLIKRLLRLPRGEYSADADDLFIRTSKSTREYEINPITGDKIAKMACVVPFAIALNEYKYGIEYLTNGKIVYVGTNDLNTIYVK